ncbi:MAG: PaaI family thioesterase [Bryobacterales bacterium]|nr:PaaI family thioesterase [Bryobacterales bacterium]
MASFRAQFPEFESQVRAVFAEQSFMRGIGAEMGSVSPGKVEIVLPVRDDLLQHHGYVHGAVIAAIVDTACGCSALTLMPAGSTVLTVEYKINFMAPAAGERLIARGRVLRPGRKLTVCSGEAVAVVNGNEKPVAALMATMVRVPPAGEPEQ